MPVRIRLRRIGRKKQPSYRIVVAHGQAPRGGVYVDNVGFYNPRRDPIELKIDLAKVEYWVARGAQITPTVQSLIRKVRRGEGEVIGAAAPAAAEAQEGAAPAKKPARKTTAKKAAAPAAEAAAPAKRKKAAAAAEAPAAAEEAAPEAARKPPLRRPPKRPGAEGAAAASAGGSERSRQPKSRRSEATWPRTAR